MATRHLETAQLAARRFGATGKAFDNYEQMLGERGARGVVVVSQPEAAFNLTLDCLKAGYPVFVDKPLGWNAAQAREVADAAAGSGQFAMVGFMKRFAPCYTMLKQYIQSGELGEPNSFNLVFGAATGAFSKNAEEYLKLAAIHVVDLVRFLFGEVKNISAEISGSGGDITLCLTLSFESGVSGSLYLSAMPAWTRERERLTVSFERGFVDCNDLFELAVHRAADGSGDFKSLGERDEVFGVTESPMSGALRDLYLRGFVGEIEHFMQCIERGERPGPNAADNMKTMQLIDDILSLI